MSQSTESLAEMKNSWAPEWFQLRKLLPLITLFATEFSIPCAANFTACEGPIVRTPSGAFMGTMMISRSGRNISAFRGMRYAQPPIGDLRFKAPVPSQESWSGVKMAVNDGASCIQTDNFVSGPKSEDCLFLNVYSTQLPDQNSNARRPVIFWIHHGGWFGLSGQSNLAGPRYLMDEDIVLVTINYRLGAFGFLSTGDSVAPGNYGLKDQLLALEWVRDNIESFGGNPNLVTIFGYSAGAASVQYHMASPQSAGLFHRAISASGSALCHWALVKKPESVVQKQAELLNCSRDEMATSKGIIKCLRGKNEEDIAKTYWNLKHWHFGSAAAFAPVIEEEGNSEAPFITKDPTTIFKSGNFAQVPWLTGTTDNEMMTRARAIVTNSTALNDLNNNFKSLAPFLFYFETEPPESTRKSTILKRFYFKNNPITNDSLQEMTDIFTDVSIFHGADRSVKIVSAVSRAPVYYYQFVYRGRYAHMPKEPGMEKPPGVSHQDDLMYLFHGDSGRFPFFGNGMPETLISKRMVKMWANFAKTGNPTPALGKESSGGNILPTIWMPHTIAGLEYMEIGENMTMKSSLRQDRASIWDQIHPMVDEKTND